MNLQFNINPNHRGELQLSQGELNELHAERDITLVFQAGSDGFDGSFRLVLPIQSEQEPWFLCPGFFYGQGRTDSSKNYPQLGFPDGKWISDSWDFALERMAYPVSLVRFGSSWQGLSWNPHYELDGDSNPSIWSDSEPQTGFGLQWSKGNGELSVNIPAYEGPRRLVGHRDDGPLDRQLHLNPHQKLSLTLRIHAFDGDAHAYAPILKYLRMRLAPEHPVSDIVADDDALSECADHGLKAWHWVEESGYFVYTASYDRSSEFNANNRGFSLGWHFDAMGFVGGFPVAFGLLWHGIQQNDADSKRIACRAMERWLNEGLSEWGLFYTSYHPGDAVTPNGKFKNGASTGPLNNDDTGTTPFYGSCWQSQPILHARTCADAALYLCRSLKLLGQEHPLYTKGLKALIKNIEVALSIQDEQGRFGQLYDVCQKKVFKSEGDGGLLWIPVLVESLALLQHETALCDKIKASAQKAGLGYALALNSAYLVGAPEDVGLTPTSEDGYNAVMAYAGLTRVFGDEPWLKYWIQACDWTLTWRKAYNVRFPKRSLLGMGQFRTVGGDFASSHNNHLHVYGANCLADFVELSLRTGDDYYATRAEEHFVFLTQLLSFDNGQWNGQRGMCSEQFYSTDWSIWGNWKPTEHHTQKGTLMGFSHVWCVNMVLLGLEQRAKADALKFVLS